jgi:hypothetical protein
MVQTTGDLLDERIVTDPLQRGVCLISVAGIDVRQRLIAVGAASASVFHVMSTSLFSYCLKFDAGLRAGRVTGCEVVVRPVCGCSAGRLRRDRTTESRTDHAALQSLSPRY